MARVLKGFHSFTCTPTRSATPAFAFPAIAGTHLPTPADLTLTTRYRVTALALIELRYASRELDL